MNTQTNIKMTADQFLAWGEKQSEGRYELVDGEIVRMAPERAKHVKIKYALAPIVEDAIRTAQADYEFLGDGIGVRVDEHHVREPDGCIARRPAVDDNSLEIKEPVVLFEVSSPSTDVVDAQDKLIEYISLPSVQHYVRINPWNGVIIHYTRESASSTITRILRTGSLDLSPPGISVHIASLLSET